MFLLLVGFVSCTHMLDPFEPVIKQRLLDLRRSVLGESEDLLTEVASRVASFYLPVHSTSASCRADSQRVIQGLLDGEMWALRMFDASSKPMSGILDGHFQDLGHFQECVNVIPPDGQFSGKHCVVETQGLLPRTLEKYLYIHDGFFEESFRVDIAFSVCVPSSCSPEDVSVHMNTFLSAMNATAWVNSHGCSTADVPPLLPREWFAILVMGSILFLVVFSTWYESKRSTDKSDIWAAFSLRKNYRTLMSTDRSQEEITCLPGLRVLANASVIVQHSYMVTVAMPISNYATLLQAMSSKWVIPHNVMIVDVFFFIGGILRTYNFLQDRKKGNPYNFLRNIYQRYVRLTPVVAVVVLFSATFHIRLNQGPLWGLSNNLLCEDCRTKWWSNLLYISNYIHPDSKCAAHLYYLCNDFQLFVLSPLLLVPLYKTPRVGLPLMVTTFLAMVLMGFVNSYVNEIPVLSFSALADLSDRAFTEDYIVTHVRPSAYILGLIMGWIIYKIKFDKWNITLSRRILVAGWFISLALWAATSYSARAFPVYGRHPFHPWLDPLYNALCRPLYVVSFAWIIFVCILGYGGFINTVLSLPVFVILGRLSFAAYVVHLIVMTSHAAARKESATWSYEDVFHDFLGYMVKTYFWAAILYLTVEAPFYKMAMRLVGGKATKKQETSSSHKDESKSD